MSTNAIQTFNFKGSDVRTMIAPDGETLFLGKDIAARAGHKDTDQAIRLHCKRAASYPVKLTGQVRRAKWIPESDVYRLLAHSQLPEAAEFEAWIFEEVLPSIRKTGSYSMPGAGPSPAMEAFFAAQTRALANLDGSVSVLNQAIQTEKAAREADAKRHDDEIAKHDAEMKRQAKALEEAQAATEKQAAEFAAKHAAIEEVLNGKPGWPTCYVWVHSPVNILRAKRWGGPGIYQAFCRGVARAYRVEFNREPEDQPIPGQLNPAKRYPVEWLNQIDIDPEFFRKRGVHDPRLNKYETPLLDKNAGRVA